MEKVFFGYSVSINKKQRKPALKDVKAVNDSTKDYMLSLSKEDIKERINECSIDSQAQPFENLLNSKLHDLGIVILNQAFDLKYIERVNQELIDIQLRIYDFLKAGSQFYEDEDILFQRGSKKLKGYSELSSYSKTVVQVREGQDEGMIDIFNIDRSSEVFRGMLESLKSSQTIKALTSQRTQVTPKNMNVYLNSGVQSTRGFHVDTYTEKLKVFVYLTDCMDLSNGPYTFVKKSHRTSSFSILNKYISSALPNRTEAPVVPLNDIIPVLAPKGSLVISDQSGIHRGFPQSPEGKRAVAVLSFH